MTFNRLYIWVFFAILAIILFLKIKKQKTYTAIPVNSEGWSPTPIAEKLHNAMSGLNAFNKENDMALSSLTSLSDAQFIQVCNEFKRLYSASLYSWVAGEWSITGDIRRAFNERAERLNVTI